MDKSPKGTLDTPIIPLINTLNSHPSYFTTSSCSGRISIFSQPLSSTAKRKAKGGSWLYASHDPADANSVLSVLFTSESAHESPDDLVFRFEPLIIAIECKDLPSAQSLVSLAICCGFRESGITSAAKRVIVTIRCSIRLEVPLGNTDRILVTPEYARFLVGIANDKMEANKRRTEGFLRALKENGFVRAEENGYGGSPNVALRDSREGVSSDEARTGDEDGGAGLKEHRTGSSGLRGYSLPITEVAIVGEPVEKLFLWGHSASALCSSKEVIVFGGFGGLGRHARRNDCLMLCPLDGTVTSIDVEDAPSARLGHTSSLVGESMFVIGGRSDPVNILNDVWVLDVAKWKWKLLECSGSVFSPRHRHAAAALGSRIYVFGGTNNEAISSTLHVLDTDSLQWSEICANGVWPSARHSHALVSYESQLFMFGGYDGEKALGDLYSFNVQTGVWKKEVTRGRTPNARFSHSMFVYQNYLCVLGGCPVRQQYQELAILDLQHRFWNHVVLDSVGKNLFVRSTACVVGDDVVVVGGGAACYAFGTTFTKPVIINLLSSVSSCNNIGAVGNVEKHTIVPCEGMVKMAAAYIHGQQNGVAQTAFEDHDFNNHGTYMNAPYWVLQLKKEFAKLGKDTLKKFGWLDLGRKVYSKQDGIHVCFPVTEAFSTVFLRRQRYLGDADCTFRLLNGEPVIIDEISSALDILKKWDATMVADEVVEFRISCRPPLNVMSESVASLIKQRGLPTELLQQLPRRWERLGDIVVLPVSSFKDPIWDSIGNELWPTVAKALNARRLARQGRVAPRGTRDSTLEILVGDNGCVEHHENGVLYSFDATKCMFSWGNHSEKRRMASMNCRNEVVVDLFAGIGYFVLPFLVRAQARLVYACDWNPHAITALRHNLQANSVNDRCVILEGDNRIRAPIGVADRVCLGLLPTSEASWVTAVRALRKEGGVLHMHANVKDTEESSWTEHVVKSIHEIARSEGNRWEVFLEHVERVKWYAPHIRHLVADVKCKQVGQDRQFFCDI